MSKCKFVGFSLTYLEPLAVAFLDYCEQLGRPLLRSEAKVFRFLLLAFESDVVREECRVQCEDDRREHYLQGLISKVRDAVRPDPFRQVRLVRHVESAAEMTAGNFKLKVQPFEGVSVRQLTNDEAADRLDLLVHLLNGMAVLSKELSYVRSCSRSAAKRVDIACDKAMGFAREFVAEFRAGGPGRMEDTDLEQIEDEMRLMADLMDNPTE